MVDATSVPTNVGSTRFEKVAFLVAKFAAQYKETCRVVPSFRHASQGETVTRWLGYLDDKTGMVNWVLLCWPGEDLDRSELWRPVHEQRIRHSGYELVRYGLNWSNAIQFEVFFWE